MNTKNKRLGVLVYVLIAVIALGIGYAAISAITLTINGSATANGKQDNFIVEFNDAAGKTTISSTPNEIASYDDSNGHVSNASVTSTKTVGTFSLYGFATKNDYADVTFTVINRSPDLKAKLCESTINVTGGSASTFSSVANLPSAVTEGTDKCITLNANGGETTIVVRTTLNVTPTIEDVSVNNIKVTFNANPVQNS